MILVCVTSKSDELSLGESASPEKHGKVSYGTSSDLMVMVDVAGGLTNTA
jgi:hypothetical protein